jgi:hypothetical protein
VDKSYWGVQGWEVTAVSGGTGACFLARPAGASNIHHIIFANDIANGCSNAGFAGNENAENSTGVDYFVVIGSIAYNTAQTSSVCTSGISGGLGDVAVDSLPGTHIYFAGNFSFDNVNPNPCAGTAPTDGEGLFFDTTQYYGYSQQMVMDNNISVFNGGGGIQTIKNSTSSPNALIYLRHNTTYGNQTGLITSTTGCAEILAYLSYSTEISYNLSVTGAATACATTVPLYVMAVMQPNSTTHFFNNYGYSAAGNNENGSVTGFSWGVTNTFANPVLANPTDPGAPNCTGTSSVPNCMATVISNFTPTNAAAAGYGYQVPSSAAVYDPLFPQWLCKVNLPSGLVTMGCLTSQ